MEKTFNIVPQDFLLSVVGVVMNRIFVLYIPDDLEIYLIHAMAYRQLKARISSNNITFGCRFGYIRRGRGDDVEFIDLIV